MAYDAFARATSLFRWKCFSLMDFWSTVTLEGPTAIFPKTRAQAEEAEGFLLYGAQCDWFMAPSQSQKPGQRGVMNRLLPCLQLRPDAKHKMRTER